MNLIWPDQPRNSTPSTPQEPVAPPRKRSSNPYSEDPVDPNPRKAPKVSRACDSCKAKKSKCSGTIPCDACAKRGWDCLYDAKYSRGRPPVPREAPVTPVSDLQPSPAEHQMPNHSLTMRNSAPVERQSYPPLAPSRGTPDQPPARPDMNSHFTDPSLSLSFLHRAWKRIANQNNQAGLGAYYLSDDQQPLTSAGDKPFHGGSDGLVSIPNQSKAAQEVLNMYFDVCTSTYRLLHRGTTQKWLDIIVSNANHDKAFGYGIDQPKVAIVLTALAIARHHEAKSLSVESPEESEERLRWSEELYAEATRCNGRETGLPRLESAQARLLQVIYLLTSSRMNQAWYTFGDALQIVSALGLHRRSNRKFSGNLAHQDYIQAQSCKRTFWVAYTLDQCMAAMFGRPRHYHEADIDQDYPDAVNDEDMTPSGPVTGDSPEDCSIESLIHHAKLAQIVGRIIHDIYPIKNVPEGERVAASHRLERDLHMWRTQLPPFLGAINPFSLISTLRTQAVALKLAYSHAVILAYRPYLIKNTYRYALGMRDSLKEGVAECITAAQVVLESVDRIARDGPIFDSFWWTHYVTYCALAVVYVWAIRQSYSDNIDPGYAKLFDLAERCLNHLSQGTASHSPSRRYNVIIQELRAEAKRQTHWPGLPLEPALPKSENAHPIPTFQAVNAPVDTAHQPSALASPLDTGQRFPGSLDDWQVTDWLDFDCAAFNFIPGFRAALIP